MDRRLAERLQSQLDLVFSSSNVGATAAIRIGPDAIWKSATGFSDLHARTPMEPDGSFLVYSITKTFTAVLILKLVQSGKLGLDDPLSRWLSDIPNVSSVTIRQLLNHTGGIPDYGVLPGYHQSVKESPSDPWPFTTFVDRTCKRGLEFKPGKSWRYTNTGYMLLHRLIEVTANRSFESVMADQIFKPLDLRRTFVATRIEHMGRLVCGHGKYLGKDHQVLDVRGIYHPGWVATGVINSTAEETARFYHALFVGDLLNAALLGEMVKLVQVPKPHPRFQSPSYGLGLMADPGCRYGILYGHTGEGPGYSAAAYHIPDVQGRPVTICVLCNFEGPDRAEGMVFDMLEIISEAFRRSVV